MLNGLKKIVCNDCRRIFFSYDVSVIKCCPYCKCENIEDSDIHNKIIYTLKTNGL